MGGKTFNCDPENHGVSWMTTDRRAFLKQSAAMGLIYAAGEVLNAQQEGPTESSRYTLANDKLRLQFDGKGLLSMEDFALGKTFHFKTDHFRVEIDEKPIDGAGLRADGVNVEPSRLTYTFSAEPYKIDIVYELRASWRFVSKQVLVSGLQEGSFSVTGAEPLQFEPAERISDLYVQNSQYPRIISSGAAGFAGPLADHDPGLDESGMKSYVAFLRMEEAQGLFTLLQNPFFECARAGQVFSLRYAPEMEWQAAWGPFPCDRACLGPYRLSGRKIPKEPVPEWRLAKSELDGQDEAEVDAVTECVREFLMTHPRKSVRMHCSWYENDYEIDISIAQGREEYKRIIDSAAAIGCDHITFAPGNLEVSAGYGTCNR